jgi:hypothetical protein
MEQRVPEFGLVEHEGPMVCDICHEEVTFLVGVSQEDTESSNHCKNCFNKVRPEFTNSIADFAELLDTFLEMKAQQMTVEEMYELYGEGAEPPTEEEEEPDEREDRNTEVD